MRKIFALPLLLIATPSLADSAVPQPPAATAGQIAPIIASQRETALNALAECGANEIILRGQLAEAQAKLAELAKAGGKPEAATEKPSD